MSQNSSIEWTEATWNPVRGCTKVSPGCANCYAETFAERWRGVKGHAYEQGFDLRLVPEKLTEPLRRKKPTTYFVNSMSDLFQEGVPETFILSVFTTMQRCPQHTFQVLTKRADRMRSIVEWVGRKFADEGEPFPLPNVWLGVSVENQHFADERIPLLLQTPAAIRFISAEPLLGPLDLSVYLRKSSKVAQRLRGDVPLDDEMGNDGGEERSGVAVSMDLPSSDRLPASALGALAVPSNRTTERGHEPFDHRAVSAVDRYPDAVGAAGAAAPVDVALSVEQAGDVGDYGLIGGDGDCLRQERSSTAPHFEARGLQLSPKRRSADAGGIGNRLDGFTGSVRGDDVHAANSTALDWLIIGGESGAGARPFDVAWARSIVSQCKAAGVPVFVKQLGTRPVKGQQYTSWGNAASLVEIGRCSPPSSSDDSSSEGDDPPSRSSQRGAASIELGVCLMALLVLVIGLCFVVEVVGRGHVVPNEVVVSVGNARLNEAAVSRSVMLFEGIHVIDIPNQPHITGVPLNGQSVGIGEQNFNKVMVVSNQESAGEGLLDIGRSHFEWIDRNGPQVRRDTAVPVFDGTRRSSAVPYLESNFVLPVADVGVESLPTVGHADIRPFNLDGVIAHVSIDPKGQPATDSDNGGQDFKDAHIQPFERRSAAALVGFLIWVTSWLLANRYRRFEVPIYLVGVGALVVGLMLT